LLAARLSTDCVAVAVSNTAAFAMRFELAIPASLAGPMLVGLLAGVGCYATAFALLRTHRSVWRYVGLEDLRRLIMAAVFGAILHATALVGLDLDSYPRSVLFATPIFVIVLSGGLRLTRRLSCADSRGEPGAPMTERRRIVIIGAGNTGESIARQLRQHAGLAHEVVGFVDDDPRLRGQTIHDLPVLGRTDELPDVVHRHSIGEAVIAIPRLSVGGLRRIGASCVLAGLPFRCLPSVSQLVRGDSRRRYLREIDIDELLTREKKSAEEPSIRSLLQESCVMVTGAGGSIGSELCRQVLRLGARPVLMVERAENALYDIALEITRRYGDGAAIPVLADVRHARRMAEVFEEFSPAIVFHAAAYKHVPMLEDHPIEAILNNVVGTRRLADMARQYGVPRFVFISTDKAASPTNVMGATKRIGEMYIRSLNETTLPPGGQGMRSVVVRFGNVLGSAGSVVPLFERQIRDGGSITITHPEVSRFFMTVSEAVGLVLQSAAMAKGGEIFVLDMGEPRKVAELADDVVLALGLSPAEVPRLYIGLRPGEKLHESLWEEGERVGRSEHEKVFMVEGRPPALSEVQTLISSLETLAIGGNVTEALQKISELFPSYRPAENGGAAVKYQVDVLRRSRGPAMEPVPALKSGA
jgi:FlaA1/EpsC-like NDP-sugar epimerase